MLIFVSQAFSQPNKQEIKADNYYYSGIEKFKKAVSKEDIKNALRGLDRAIRINNKYAEAYYQRGNIKNKQSNYTEALMDYDKAIEIDPKYYDAYISRGTLRKDFFNDYEGAEIDYKTAVQLKPEATEAYYGMSQIKYFLMDYRKAINLLDKCIAIDSFNPKFFISRGDAKAKVKEYKSSLEDYNKAIELDKKSLSYYNRGMLFYDQNRFTEAIEDFSKVIEVEEVYLNIFFPDPYYYRGLAKYNQGDLRSACDDWQKLYTLGRKRKMNFKNTKELIRDKCSQLPSAPNQ